MPCKNPFRRSRDRWRQPAFDMTFPGIGGTFFLCLACLLLLSCSYHAHLKQSVFKPLAMHIQPQDIPIIPIDSGNKALFEDAAGKDLSALSILDPDKSVQFGGISVKVSRLKATVLDFLQLLDEDLSQDAFQYELSQRFDFYKLEDDEIADDDSPLLVTGYFQPELRASLAPDSLFAYPLYGMPDDLIRVKLSDFAPDLPSVTIWGRISDHGLVPYYTRQEIDSGDWSNNAPVLAWLASPIDSLMLHIQGSGILLFEDGGRRFVHYAASNGLPYRSVGSWLIGHGFLNEGQADWPHIHAWAKANPDLFKEAIASNPRYIFFKWERDGPVGSLGKALTPLISVALDPEIYPPGILCFLEFAAQPAMARQRDGDFKGLVFNQDTGAAIKGPRRLDLYCGAGDRAGEMAGRLKARGKLYIMLAKTPE